jgi:hypothetical protein
VGLSLSKSNLDFPDVSDSLHICIVILLLIAFSYVMCLRNYQKELHMSFYRHSHFSYLCSTKSGIFAPNNREVVEFPSCLESKKDHCLLPIILYLIVNFNFDYISCISSLPY